MTTITVYTRKDVDRLIGGDCQDWLFAQLIEMAAYDHQDAEIEYDASEQMFTIIQTPHQGEPVRSTSYGPVEDVVEVWLDSEKERTGRAEVYNFESHTVDVIRDVIAAEQHS